MTAYGAILIDSIKINGIIIEGFESGNLDNWDIYTEGSATYAAIDMPYDGSYSGLFSLDGSGYIDALLSLGSVSPSDTIEFHYMCGINAYECSYLTVVIAITDGDYGNTLVLHEGSDFELYDEGWITFGASALSEFGLEDPTSLTFEIYIEIGGGGEPSESQRVLIQFDDIEVLGETEWTEFLNGDFETGDLSHWNEVGTPAATTDLVHAGSYSCVVHDGDCIAQRITLADMEQVNVYYYITDSGSLVIDILDLESNPYNTWTHSATTSGWYNLRLDVSSATTDYIINIESIGATAYIDDITVQATFDSVPYNDTFDTRSWFHTTYNPAWNTTSSVSYTDGIDETYCVRLNTAYRYGQTCNAAVYNFINMSLLDSITFMYRIPTFDPGYLNMGGAWLKVQLSQDGSPTLTYTVADADNGAITDWTEYSIDVSALSGTYKITIYAEATDAGYTLHPSETAYIDNVQYGMPPVLLTQHMYIRNQYDTDSRCTDMFYNDVPLASVNDRLFSHRLTDTGHFINFDELDMADEGYLHQVQHIYNVLHMKIRRVK